MIAGFINQQYLGETIEEDLITILMEEFNIEAKKKETLSRVSFLDSQ